MSSLRILHVIPSYLPAVRYGGPLYAVHGLCKHLVNLGHHVDVFTTNVDGDDVLGCGSEYQITMDGVGVHYFPVQFPRRLYYSPQLAHALDAKITNYDLLHLHSLYLHPILAAARCATKNNIPYLIAPRGMLIKDLIQRKNTLLKMFWISLFERRTLEQASAIHVTSSLEALEIEKFPFNWPEILEYPNGVEPPAMAARIEREQNLILFLGRIHWKKGLDRLIPALSGMPDVRLIIAGNDESGYLEDLRILAAKYHVTGQISFYGPVHDEDKWRLYQQAGVFVLPSYSENFANTVLEAMAMACPVVVTPQVGLAQTVQDSGAGIVCGGEPSILHDAIKQVIDNPPLAQKMGEAGQHLILERFAWPNIASSLETDYYRLLTNQQASTLA